ncbi:DUF429 domain-containing protein [Geomesophilobacter sediminis]|uniref:FRG domain-containing protein n=1 Tax=Geomesophilobacter sediminis TaxID=2798584 RepID=A0A8J7M211_9BACT|nr:DUF429 domain-containing protein [Geomesophilobacter sediminis]MBJ6727172.1 FRG domain-containing protein [Geomesophilobacter sediminis]
MDAYAGIDIAFAKKKLLPVSVCAWRDGVLEPLPLRSATAPLPPQGSGNAKILDDAIVKEFAELTVRYLRDVERTFGVTIRRIAIDAPSDPKVNGATRREAEKGLDRKKISCISTPNANQFGKIRDKAKAHLANGGEESRLPHANQLWMLVGFDLFRRLRQEWECLEVFPQAIAVTLGANGVHKTKEEGLLSQLSAAARFTGWPTIPDPRCLNQIGYGRHHDNLDAYLAAWVASLDVKDREPIGIPPNDVIWVPRVPVEQQIQQKMARSCNWSQQLQQVATEWKMAMAGTDRVAQEPFLGDRPFGKFVFTEHAGSWSDFQKWVDGMEGSWGFRGQRESSWSLETSLDRAVRVEYENGYHHLDRDSEQDELLFRFRQQAHHYISHFPAVEDLASWLAIMQHHGVPTRLLDWTKSAYVASYFAFLEEPYEETCAVWAINLDWIDSRGHELVSLETVISVMQSIQTNGGNRYSSIPLTKEPVIVKVDPLRANQRMIAQQGFFLCRLLHEASFCQTLMRMIMTPEVPNVPVLKKLTVDKNLRIEFLKKLREMNIHAGSLFPGLDGFAQSLRHELEIKVDDARQVDEDEAGDM